MPPLTPWCPHSRPMVQMVAAHQQHTSYHAAAERLLSGGLGGAVQSEESSNALATVCAEVCPQPCALPSVASRCCIRGSLIQVARLQAEMSDAIPHEAVHALLVPCPASGMPPALRASHGAWARCIRGIHSTIGGQSHGGARPRCSPIPAVSLWQALAHENQQLRQELERCRLPPHTPHWPHTGPILAPYWPHTGPTPLPRGPSLPTPTAMGSVAHIALPRPCAASARTPPKARGLGGPAAPRGSCDGCDMADAGGHTRGRWLPSLRCTMRPWRSMLGQPAWPCQGRYPLCPGACVRPLSVRGRLRRACVEGPMCRQASSALHAAMRSLG